MFNKLRNLFFDEQYEKLKNRIAQTEKWLAGAQAWNRERDSFWYRMYINECKHRQKLVRVYEEKKVKYNSLQGRYQSKADRLRNLEEKTACFGGMMKLLNFREQCIKDACAILAKEPVESAPGVETATDNVGVVYGSHHGNIDCCGYFIMPEDESFVGYRCYGQGTTLKDVAGTGYRVL